MCYTNHEGYVDPTPSKAIHNTVKKRKRNFFRMLDEIDEVCIKYGYRRIGRIKVRDNTTGKIIK